MKKMTLLLLLLSLGAQAWSFWARTPKRDNIHDRKSPIYVAGPGAQNGLRVYVKDPSSNLAVQGAVVMLNNDNIGALTTDIAGLAEFFNVTRPVDVHIFSPLSGGVPTRSPYVATFFGVQGSQVTATFQWLISGPGSSYASVFTCITGLTPSAKNLVSHRFFGANNTDKYTSAWGAYSNCTGLGGFSFPIGGKVNTSAIAWNGGGGVQSAYFHPQMLLTGDVTVTAAAASTGYTVSTVSGGFSNTAGWAAVDLYGFAGPSSSNHWNIGYLAGLTPTTALALQFPFPPASTYFAYDYDVRNSWDWNAVTRQASGRGLFVPGSVVSIPMPGPVSFSSSNFSASNGTVTITDASGFSSATLTVVDFQQTTSPWGSYWVGLAAASTGSFTRPQVFPAGYGANVLPLASASIRTAIMRSNFSGAGPWIESSNFWTPDDWGTSSVSTITAW